MDQNRPDMPLTEAADVATVTATDATPDIRQPKETGKKTTKKPPRLLKKGRGLFAEYGYLLIAAGVPAALFLLMYIAQGVYPLGDYSVLSLDLNAQYIGFYHALRNFLHGDASLLYSFSRNLGGEFLGTFAYYAASPFACIVALFPETRMLEALLTLFTLKTALMGLTMGFYLHKQSTGKPNHPMIVAFSTMYALCSYAIVQQTNSMWIDALIWLPILTYGLEELIKKGHFRLFTFALAITIFSNYYIGYMVCIYVLAYSFYYYFAHNRNNENNPMGEKNHFIKSVGRVALWSVVAVCMTAAIVLAAKYSLSFGKSDFSNPSWDIEQKFQLILLPYKLLPSSYDTVGPGGVPILYCGTLALLMAPAFFLCKKFSDREKIASACFILFFVLSFSVSTLDLIWHGFQKPNWLNYRYSFMFSFFLLTLAYRAFDRMEFISRKSLVAIAAVWGGFVLTLQLQRDLMVELVQQMGQKSRSGTKPENFTAMRPWATVGLVLACLLIYFVLICVAGRTKRAKKTVCTILAFVVVVEMFLSGLSDTQAFVKDVGHTGYSTHNNYYKTFLPISDAIQELDQGFYRTEKTYSRQKADNFGLQFKGLTCSTSTLNQDVIDLLDTMGYASKSHWSKYVGGNPVADSVLGIKYLVTDNDMTDFYGEPVIENEEIEYDEDFSPVSKPDVYQNPYALSLVFGVADAYEDFHVFTENDDGKRVDVYNSPMDLFNEMITAMLGETETVEVFKKVTQVTPFAEAETVNCTYTTYDSGRHHGWKKDDTAKDASITLKYEVPTGTDLYMYIPSGYPREVKVYVNGTQKGGYDGSTDSTYRRIASLGESDTSELTLKLQIANSSNNLYIRSKDEDGERTYDTLIYYIDQEVLADAMTRLQAMGYQIDEGYTDDHLTGSIKTEQTEQLIATTIPYDEGWKVYVDGERVETFRTADALLGFRIENTGEHTLEMKYMPNSIAFGIVVSVLATIAFILLAVLYRWLRRLPLVGAVFTVPGEPLPVAETPESRAAIAPGDIGDDPPEVEPVSADAPEDIDERSKKKNKKKR